MNDWPLVEYILAKGFNYQNVFPVLVSPVTSIAQFLLVKHYLEIKFYVIFFFFISIIIAKQKETLWFLC
jgi:uncharacterized membrane protein YraQ (UPF0718 family)